jgi:hypothetical protein
VVVVVVVVVLVVVVVVVGRDGSRSCSGSGAVMMMVVADMNLVCKSDVQMRAIWLQNTPPLCHRAAPVRT